MCCFHKILIIRLENYTKGGGGGGGVYQTGMALLCCMFLLNRSVKAGQPR